MHARKPWRPLERCCARGGQRAFTLIEVVVALVVVSLGMLAVIQAVGQSASNSGYLREKTLAHWVAMNRLTEVRLEKSPPKVDKTSDDVEMGDRRWRWTMTVTQSAVESIRRVDISVRQADAPEGTALATVTGYYGTAIAPPGSTPIDWQGSAQGNPPGQKAGEGTPLDPAPEDNTPREPQPPAEQPPETEE